MLRIARRQLFPMERFFRYAHVCSFPQIRFHLVRPKLGYPSLLNSDLLLGFCTTPYYLRMIRSSSPIEGH